MVCSGGAQGEALLQGCGALPPLLLVWRGGRRKTNRVKKGKREQLEAPEMSPIPERWAAFVGVDGSADPWRPRPLATPTPGDPCQNSSRSSVSSCRKRAPAPHRHPPLPTGTAGPQQTTVAAAADRGSGEARPLRGAPVPPGGCRWLTRLCPVCRSFLQRSGRRR